MEGLTPLIKHPREVVKANKSTIKKLTEIAYNLYLNHVTLTPAERRNLLKYRTALKGLVSKKATWKKRKQILIKHYALLPHLLKPIKHLLT